MGYETPWISRVSVMWFHISFIPQALPARIHGVHGIFHRDISWDTMGNTNIMDKLMISPTMRWVKRVHAGLPQRSSPKMFKQIARLFQEQNAKRLVLFYPIIQHSHGNMTKKLWPDLWSDVLMKPGAVHPFPMVPWGDPIVFHPLFHGFLSGYPHQPLCSITAAAFNLASSRFSSWGTLNTRIASRTPWGKDCQFAIENGSHSWFTWLKNIMWCSSSLCSNDVP